MSDVEKTISDPGSRISDIEKMFRIPDPGFRILKSLFGSRISDIEKSFRIPDPGSRILKNLCGSRISDIETLNQYLQITPLCT